MLENRISELFQFISSINIENGVDMPPSRMLASATVAQLLPIVATQDIYQIAATQARYNHELDRLFNPDYYRGGSGI